MVTNIWRKLPKNIIKGYTIYYRRKKLKRGVGMIVDRKLCSICCDRIKKEGMSPAFSTRRHNCYVIDNNYFLKISIDPNLSASDERFFVELNIQDHKDLLQECISYDEKQKAILYRYLPNHILANNFKDLTETNWKYLLEFFCTLSSARVSPSMYKVAKIHTLQQKEYLIQKIIPKYKKIHGIEYNRSEYVLHQWADTFGKPNSKICHGDARLGNLMISPKGKMKLVDYESYFFAPAYYDIARLTANYIYENGMICAKDTIRKVSDFVGCNARYLQSLTGLQIVAQMSHVHEKIAYNDKMVIEALLNTII